jgi:3-hydroxybutyryl-CoA dehydrogenase
MRTLLISVIGAGVMGTGIAQLLAQRGHEVRLADVDEARARAALAQIRDTFAMLLAKGKIDEATRARGLHNLSIATNVAESVRGADWVVEAVLENMDAKVALLNSVCPSLDAGSLVASNTSSLSVTELGARTGMTDRLVGMHFFNPVPLMELVEVVRGLDTPSAVVERAVTFAQRLGKTPIVVRDVPGFATSRLGVLLGCEAMRMVESGVASVADIDLGMELGYRHPMGPLKLTDLVGLDVRLAILDHLHRELGEQFRPPALLRTMVRAGKLGKKSGEGFYRWVDGKPVPQP